MIQSPSLVDTYRDTLVQLLGEENLDRVQELPKDTFDPKLWEEMMRIESPSYHSRVFVDLTPGYIWCQEDAVEKAVLLWQTTPFFINRAYHRGDSVVVESYIDHVLTRDKRINLMPCNQFQEHISKFLKSHVATSKDKIPSLAARKLQRELGQIPIHVEISKVACEKLMELTMSGKRVVIEAGFDYKDEPYCPFNRTGTSLMSITEYFTQRRLLTLYEENIDCECLSESVAPIIHVFDDFIKLISYGIDDMLHRTIERSVRKIDDEARIDGKSLQDLKIFLFDACRVEAFNYDAKITAGHEGLNLNINFVEDKWALDWSLTMG